MDISIIAHASVLVRMGSEQVLVDPVFAEVFASGTLCFNPPRALDVDALLARTTLLAITHIHLDHFHPETLSRFSRDLPVLAPPHRPLISAIRELGFNRVTELAPWQSHQAGEARLTATPSDFELDEFGLVFCHGEDRYWHMSDAIVTAEVGRRVHAEFGAMSVTAVRYQPVRTLVAYQRGLQSTRLDRDELAAGLEAACESRPARMFPYFSGFAFHGEYAWANRHVAPYSDSEIAALLRRRTAGRVEVAPVAPGDQLRIEGRQVEHRRAAAGFVGPAAGPAIQPWEPIDPATLAGLAAPAQRTWLALELIKLLRAELMPWLHAHLRKRSGLFDAYVEYAAVWQCTVHVGEGRRLVHAIDFRPPEAELMLDCRHSEANVFGHVGARDLLRVLRGEAGAEVFWMAGGYRIYEKILCLRDGHISEPPERDWALFERLPDPLVHYLRRMGRQRLVGGRG